MEHIPDCESSCFQCPICRAAGRGTRDGGASSIRGWCRRWGWHSRLSYPIPRRPGEVHHHRSHLRRGLAWRTAVRAFLLAPPPWDSQVGPATCFLYTPLCSVLESSRARKSRLHCPPVRRRFMQDVPVSSVDLETTFSQQKCQVTARRGLSSFLFFFNRIYLR